MKTFDELSYNEVIELYYEKHHALRAGDMSKLLEIKKHCPDLFNKQKDEQVRDMIEYAKAFQTSDRYKELQRMDMKRKLTVITNDGFEK